MKISAVAVLVDVEEVVVPRGCNVVQNGTRRRNHDSEGRILRIDPNAQDVESRLQNSDGVLHSNPCGLLRCVEPFLGSGSWVEERYHEVRPERVPTVAKKITSGTRFHERPKPTVFKHQTVVGGTWPSGTQVSDAIAVITTDLNVYGSVSLATIVELSVLSRFHLHLACDRDFEF